MPGLEGPGHYNVTTFGQQENIRDHDSQFGIFGFYFLCFCLTPQQLAIRVEITFQSSIEAEYGFRERHQAEGFP